MKEKHLYCLGCNKIFGQIVSANDVFAPEGAHIYDLDAWKTAKGAYYCSKICAERVEGTK
jgi:hypothetical protein